jgi:hypothetical protein
MDMCWQCQRRQSDLVNFGKHNIGEPRNKNSAVLGEAKASYTLQILTGFYSRWVAAHPNLLV